MAAKKNPRSSSVTKIRTLRAAVPPTRDPFINARMTPLPPEKRGDETIERFWISTWNSRSGSLGAVVNEHGDNRIYRFNDVDMPGFYSAAAPGDDDPHGLWLSGWLNKSVRLDLATGKAKAYDNTAPQALVFEGMPMDRATGKMLTIAFPPPKTVAVVFDYRSRKPVKVQDVPSPGHYMRASFPNGDGTWTIVLHVPGDRLVVWDPRDDSLEEVHHYDHDPHAITGTTFQLIRDDTGRVYLPHQGWYDPKTRRVEKEGPRPSEEMTWFGRLGDKVVGVNVVGANAALGLWDIKSGAVTPIGSISNCTVHNVTLTVSGRVVAVNVYGEFFRIEAMMGAIECTRRLDADAVGPIDCLSRLDKDRVLGTPFITQRFWEVNMKTGRGFDAGRAAPGFGEIMRLKKLGGKVYMAAYADGELMEYDPALPPRYPENPRLVADPPGGMRPVAICDDGQNIFYSCSMHYGNLGSILTRYDKRTGAAAYAANPLPNQQVNNLIYDKTSRRLLAGTTFHADCQSCPPTSDLCYFATLDPATLRVLEQWPAPKGSVGAGFYGPLGGGRWLCSCGGTLADGRSSIWFAWDLKAPLPASPTPIEMPEQLYSVHATARPGLFVLHAGNKIELWDLRQPARLRTLYAGRGHVHHTIVEDDSVLLAVEKDVVVLDGCLKK